MKRVSVFLCSALILVTCLTNPVSAADISFTNDFIVNVLDYATADNDNYLTFTNTATFTYILPFNSIYNYVDILFSFSGSEPVLVNAGWGELQGLNIVQVSERLYRCYGSIGNRSTSGLSVQFITNSSVATYLEILTFNAYRSGFSVFDERCNCQINANEYDRTIQYFVGDEINYRIFNTTSENPQDQWLTLYLWSDNWKKYDYLEFTLFTVCQSINSITCIMGTDTVPFEATQISSPAGYDYHYTYSIVVDCSGLDRSIDDYPMVIIEGKVLPGEGDLNSVNVLGCVGTVNSRSVSPELFFLRNIFNAISSGFSNLSTWIISQTTVIESQFDMSRSHLATWFNSLNTWIATQTTAIESQFDRSRTHLATWFNSLNTWIATQTTAIEVQFDRSRTHLSAWFNSLSTWINTQTDILEAAIRGDTAPGESFQDQVDQKDQQLENMADVMESVTQPALDSVNVSADTMVDPNVLAVSMSGLTSVIGDTGSIFYQMIVMSIMMSTAGFVLFGKR